MHFEQEWLKELDKESIPHNEDLQAWKLCSLGTVMRKQYKKPHQNTFKKFDIIQIQALF